MSSSCSSSSTGGCLPLQVRTYRRCLFYSDPHYFRPRRCKPFQQTPPPLSKPSYRAATERIITFPPSNIVIILSSFFRSRRLFNRYPGISKELSRLRQQVWWTGEDTVRLELDRLDKKTETESIQSRLQLSLFLHPHSKRFP